MHDVWVWVFEDSIWGRGETEKEAREAARKASQHHRRNATGVKKDEPRAEDPVLRVGFPVRLSTYPDQSHRLEEWVRDSFGDP